MAKAPKPKTIRRKKKTRRGPGRFAGVRDTFVPHGPFPKRKGGPKATAGKHDD